MEQKQWIDLNNKVVIVTGGAMGIGEAMVKDLLACNARVAIFDLAKPKDFLKMIAGCMCIWISETKKRLRLLSMPLYRNSARWMLW